MQNPVKVLTTMNTMQDYLILKILPHRWFASPFKIVEEGVSIRLVTDTWLDTSGSDERLGYL